MRPSIMSLGATTSQPACACTMACSHSTCYGLVVENLAIANDAVLPVAGVGVERDVADYTDVVVRILDGANGAAD